MAKGKSMTLRQAAERLKTTPNPYGFEAIKKAVLGGRLPAKLIDAPVPYYLVSEEALLAWASDDSQHRAGRPAKGK